MFLFEPLAGVVVSMQLQHCDNVVVPKKTFKMCGFLSRRGRLLSEKPIGIPSRDRDTLQTPWKHLAFTLPIVVGITGCAFHVRAIWQKRLHRP